MSEANALQAVEMVLIRGDLSGLKEVERLNYYNAVCSSVGLNPLTRPFEYITLNNKLTLYAKRDCTDQLRKIHSVSVRITARERVGDLYVVTAQATLPNGRCDESIGAVVVGHLKGDALANAFMKAETKAKRRVTLSICGLGLLDETELDTVAVTQTQNTVRALSPSKNNDPKNDDPTSGPMTKDEHHSSDSSDQLGGSELPAGEVKKTNRHGLSQKQIARMFAIARTNKWQNEEIKSYLERFFEVRSTDDLDKWQYETACEFLKENTPDVLDGPKFDSENEMPVEW